MPYCVLGSQRGGGGGGGGGVGGGCGEGGNIGGQTIAAGESRRDVVSKEDRV